MRFSKADSPRASISLRIDVEHAKDTRESSCVPDIMCKSVDPRVIQVGNATNRRVGPRCHAALIRLFESHGYDEIYKIYARSERLRALNSDVN